MRRILHKSSRQLCFCCCCCFFFFSNYFQAILTTKMRKLGMLENPHWPLWPFRNKPPVLTACWDCRLVPECRGAFANFRLKFTPTPPERTGKSKQSHCCYCHWWLSVGTFRNVLTGWNYIARKIRSTDWVGKYLSMICFRFMLWLVNVCGPLQWKGGIENNANAFKRVWKSFKHVCMSFKRACVFLFPLFIRKVQYIC